MARTQDEGAPAAVLRGRGRSKRRLWPSRDPTWWLSGARIRPYPLAPLCQWQRFKPQRKGSLSSFPAEERAFRLREQTDCRNPASDTTSGLVAYLDGVPVGWCAVEPRPAYEGLVRAYRVPWQGRDEDKSDGSIWAVTCVFARAGFRRRGISYGLVRAAVDFVRQRGARVSRATRC